MRHHEAHGRCYLVRIGITEQKTNTEATHQQVLTICYHYTEALFTIMHVGRKMKICKTHQIFNVTGEKFG